MAEASGSAQPKFIPSIAEGLRACMGRSGTELRTLDFVSLIDRIILVFDHLGPILHFAKQDMHAKAETLRAAAQTHETLQSMVEADQKAGIATQKNSCARNLHRLTSVLKFMRLLLAKLLEAPTIPLKDAATHAYEGALSPIHPYAVRTAVWAGMYMLPTRAQFLNSLSETEESAAGPASEFASGAEEVEKAILTLYAAEMPASDVVPMNMFASWGWGTTAAAAAPAAAAAAAAPSETAPAT